MNMKIYKPGSQGRHPVYVQPGNDFPHVRDWRAPDGKAKMFTVVFVNGEAEVEDKLGEYMIKKEMASKSPIITDLAQAS